MTTGKTEKSRPSKARRDRLRAAESKKSHQTISNLVPIERYYDVATKILTKFDHAVKVHALDDAFIYGRRFLNFSMELLPKHDYYLNRASLKEENKGDMYRVMDELERTVELMDLEELERREIRRREEEALRVIREREALMKKEEEERAATNELLNRLKMLDQQFPRAPVGDTKKIQEAKKQQQQQQQQQEEDYDDELEDLPPPILFSSLPPPNLTATDDLPPPPPPSYDQLQSKVNNEQLPPSYDRAALLKQRSEFKLQTKNKHENLSLRSLNECKSNLGDTIPGVNLIHSDDKDGDGSAVPSCPPFDALEKPPSTPTVPLTILRRACLQEYDSLVKHQTVQIFTLSTYQGRITTPGLDSTNGCAVISPLVAAHHLSSNGAGIADADIERIVDRVAPPILNRVRKKLGLGPLALIIPSDVHDFLVDEGILKQDKFVGVCGGNLLDEGHVKEFLDIMEGVEDDKNGDGDEAKEEGGKTGASSSKLTQKVAATLFFHEHVVSIVKVVLSNGTSWYDLVDSLPRRQNNGAMGATRTRCKSRDSLRTVLFWYATRKFSQTDEQYIDSNDWDDTMCDLDPRVFQAFAWRE